MNHVYFELIKIIQEVANATGDKEFVEMADFYRNKLEENLNDH